MLRYRRSRRALALFLVVLGGVMMFLAPEVWGGLAVLALGVVIELVGILVTSRQPADLPAFMREMIKLLANPSR
ncbi:MAG: hypothetical protein U0932_09470 [Thiobacillus sp.]|nr:hypothetical protein [Thiobacillus sp.]